MLSLASVKVVRHKMLCFYEIWSTISHQRCPMVM